MEMSSDEAKLRSYENAKRRSWSSFGRGDEEVFVLLSGSLMAKLSFGVLLSPTIILGLRFRGNGVVSGTTVRALVLGRFGPEN